MPYRTFTAAVTGGFGTGTATISIQQPNATMEWDIYQISISCSNLNCPVKALVYINGFFLCSTPSGSQDTAHGPPDIILTRNDTLNIVFNSGNGGDTVTAGIWYMENPAGTTPDLSP